jgi:uncharacterized protein YegP (UPF0339 family)
MKTRTEFIVYRDREEQWRWRAKRAGRIVAESGEGYRRRASLFRALRRFIGSILAGQYHSRYGSERDEVAAAPREKGKS